MCQMENEPQTPNTIAQNTFLKEPDDESYGEEMTKTPKIVFFVYSLLFLYGLSFSYLFGTHWWEMYAWYASGIGSFFIWHILAHQKWTGLMHQYHMEHHFVAFPPKYFFGNPKIKQEEKEYDWRDYLPLARFKSIGTVAHDGPMYVLAIIVLVVAYKLGASKASLYGGMFELMVVGTIGVYLHNSFHVKNHWLEQFQWFHELRALHYIHHLGNTNHNFAVMNFSIDKFLHMYHSEKPTNDDLHKDAQQVEHKDSPLHDQTIKEVRKYEKKQSFHSKLVGFH